MRLVIDNLFKDFLPDDMLSNISYVSLGTETYEPFDFDALGMKNEQSNLDYYGWEINGDSLKLYQTKETVNQNSGFAYYDKSKLDTVYIK